MSTAVPVARLVLSVWMFMTVTSSETRAEAESDILGPVPGVLNDRNGIVYTDWAEWRYPLQADAGADAHRVAGKHRVARGRRAAETPQRADVDERLAENPDLLGQAERKAELGGAGVEVGAAQRVGGDRIARADATDPEAAQGVAADEEQVVQAQRGVVVGEDGADRAADRRHEILDDGLVIHRVGGGADILLGARQRSKRHRVAQQQALGGVEARIAGVPGDRLG